MAWRGVGAAGARPVPDGTGCWAISYHGLGWDRPFVTGVAGAAGVRPVPGGVGWFLAAGAGWQHLSGKGNAALRAGKM